MNPTESKPYFSEEAYPYNWLVRKPEWENLKKIVEKSLQLAKDKLNLSINENDKKSLSYEISSLALEFYFAGDEIAQSHKEIFSNPDTPSPDNQPLLYLRRVGNPYAPHLLTNGYYHLELYLAQKVPSDSPLIVCFPLVIIQKPQNLTRNYSFVIPKTYSDNPDLVKFYLKPTEKCLIKLPLSYSTNNSSATKNNNKS